MIRGLRQAALLLFLACSGAGGAMAVQPDEVLQNPQLESRAREISAELRCLVCQNQSIDDSDAPLARDLRLLVRERLSAGDSDSQVVQFLVDRYGEFVLLRPRLSAATYLLWIAPVLIFLTGVFLVRRTLIGNASQPSASPDLSDTERRRLDALLRDGPGQEDAGQPHRIES
jgi:cytochrome c-type biogenesis protein CcmH